MNYTYYPDELYHHGILGQKWGVRRFQNPDGTWTDEGLKRRRSAMGRSFREYGIRRTEKRINKEKDYYKKNTAVSANESQNINYYSHEMSKALASRKSAEAAIQKHINSFGAKLIGVDESKLKKYQKQIEKADYNYLEAEARKLNSEDNKWEYDELAKENIRNIEKYEKKYEKKVDNYIKLYGPEAILDIADIME